MTKNRGLLTLAIATITLLGLAVWQLPALAQAPAQPPAQPRNNSVLTDIVDSGTRTGTAAGLASQTGATEDLRVVIAKIIRNVMGILGFLVVCLILYAGYLWMTAQGDSDQIGKAKKIILNATIGLAIIMSAYAVAFFVVSAIGNTENQDVIRISI
ncbi:MAG: hypothetical protein WCT10_04400 [Patescibacteria group bacterium]|jgi:hypothetical protein